ncbi:MAG: type II toxin-antitoxin system HicB family antitoxin [Clostridia bacterium]|nr:type II toxin-antitoxin system HicB family antitoxin [Clostridia bacterium]
MKKYTYPAVLYRDEERDVYIIAMFDLGIVAEGDTMEEAHKAARESLDTYIECAYGFDLDLPEASSFEAVIKAHPKELCVLVESSTINKKHKAI